MTMTATIAYMSNATTRLTLATSAAATVSVSAGAIAATAIDDSMANATHWVRYRSKTLMPE